MGLIDGTADYLFLWATGSGALEAKVGKNGQQPNQIDFEVWCTEMGVPYRTFTSVEEGLLILTEWGLLPPNDARCVEKSADSASGRSEEHTSELQSLMRISYAVFCLKKKRHSQQN